MSLLLLFVFTSIWGVVVFCYSPYKVNYKVVLAISYLSTLLTAMFRHSVSFYFVYTLAFVVFITTFSFIWLKLQLIEDNPTLPNNINELFNSFKKYIKYLYKYWYLCLFGNILLLTFIFYYLNYALDFDTLGFILLAVAMFAIHTIYTTEDTNNNQRYSVDANDEHISQQKANQDD